MNNVIHPWKRGALAAIAVLGLAGAACGDGGSNEATPTGGVTGGASFAAPVDGTNALVAVVVNPGDRRVLAYLCDGATLSTWFTGDADPDGTVSLTATNGARLSGRIEGSKLVGTVTPAGEASAHAFSAQTVSAPAGLYRAKGEVGGQAAIGGWVVLADGRQTGRVTTSSGFTSSDTDLARPPKPVTSFTSTEVDF